MRRTGLRRHGGLEENAGDPLDGLVNLFDIGIVLAVAFLIGGLSLALGPQTGKLDRAPTRPGHRADRTGSAQTKVRVLRRPPRASRARGRGQPVGTVYRLSDGRLVVVSPR